MLLHVLRHVDADHRPLVVEEEVGERPRDLGLADSGRPQKEEGADRPVGVLETGARAAHRRCDRGHGVLLTDHPFADSFLHTEELVLLALEQTRHRDPGPTGDRARDVLLGHLLGEDDAVLVLVGFERIGSVLELLFEAHELAVTQLCRPLEISVALGAVGRLAGFFDLFLELLEPRDELLLLVPLGLEPRNLLLELGQILLDSGAALLRSLVLLLGQRTLLDLELEGPSIELVDLGRHRIDLDAQPRRRLVHEIDRLVGQEAVGDVAVGQRRRRD